MLTLTVNPNANTVGTSFHDTVVRATFNQLQAAFGPPAYDGPQDEGEKVSKEWVFKYGGSPITLYDWKEGPFGPNTLIHWHVGGHSEDITLRAAAAILAKLK